MLLKLFIWKPVSRNAAIPGETKTISTRLYIRKEEMSFATETSKVFDSIRENGWKDSYAVVHGDIDPRYTVHEFQGENYTMGSSKGKIDFIFCKGTIDPIGSTIIMDQKDKKYPSDHYFLSADIKKD